MTVLAYALVIIPISTLVVTLGVFVGMFVFGLPLFFIPEKQRGAVVGFLCGVLGEAAGFGYGYLIFRWLVGPDSFTVVPICVAAIPLLLPPINDLRKARQVAAAATGFSDYSTVTSQVASFWGAGIGEGVGFFVGIVVFGVVL